jgi:hypothetical protein
MKLSRFSILLFITTTLTAVTSALSAGSMKTDSAAISDSGHAVNDTAQSSGRVNFNGEPLAPGADSSWEESDEGSGADSVSFADSTGIADSTRHLPASPDSGKVAMPKGDSTPEHHPGGGTLGDSIPRAQPIPVRPAWLYRGLSVEQDAQARAMIAGFFNFDWDRAEKAVKKMQRIEKHDRLPPLSYLLLVGMQVFRVQNGETEDDRQRKNLQKEIEKISQKGLELANPDKAPDSLKAINLFITGGIKGFLATLEIDKNPINAALNGFSAQKQLQKAVQIDSTLCDAYLGLGLFNCVLSKASILVRGALNIIGKDVSLERGLAYMRRSAYHGCYTNDIAKLYLVRFLSPYWGHEAAEKDRIFRMLQSRYPANPYYLFLEIEENLCFHPGALTGISFTDRIKRQVKRLKEADFSSRRYATLVKWQYLLVDRLPASGIAPDTTRKLGGFSYYPAFLQAMKEKFLFENEASVSKRDRARRQQSVRAAGTRAIRQLDASDDMPKELKNYYLWHIKDAVKVK